MKTERAYLCDGTACEKQCANTMTPEQWKNYPCHYTTDERFARIKCRRERRWTYSNGKMMEVEPK